MTAVPPLRRLGGAVLDALLPPRCLGCGEAVLRQGTLCALCFSATPLITPPCCDACGLLFADPTQAELGADGAPYCSRCLMAPPLYGQARAAFLYGEGSKRLLLPFKHGDRGELAGPLAWQMARAGRDLLARAELILPVPLHRWRLLRRRYNQAALLAAALARLSGRPWAPDLLRRPRRTPALGEKGLAARLQAVAGAFDLAPGAAARIAGRRLLLVDDVLTTGATVSACCHVLLQGGAAAVDVLAAARVPDPWSEAEANPPPPPAAVPQRS
ncbi:phosphoribosyltransferase [Pseudoroseomonas deserti]|uniref:Phosphoribosyltransferase n=1 Tax=Teichococcus deserti TaxID=1817963 RepID=A0A1V2GUK3_9PROT|nr:double zinc ribbon domain-containing protein [Pseudoroseomonas deserti]ONG45445.1 phosphoribosyltransferase [Pseudoroseomonas deserti]